MSELRIRTAGGGERAISRSAISSFAARLRGDLLTSEHAGYDAARKIFNGMIDKRPALIARCAGTADVLACVCFAREHDLLVSVRSGGHNYAGKSVCDGGLMIDLSPMKGIRVDPGALIVDAQPGLRLGEFDRETQAFGLATTLGVNTDTGIAGLTLGGGYGWLNGKLGLACDNLLAVDIVTADGQLLHASAEEHPDLLWGIRGAGANLGIVTSLRYRLHPVGPVLGGIVMYPFAQARSVLRLFDEFSQTCPDEVSTQGVLLTLPSGGPGVAIAACCCAPVDQAEKLLAPLTRFGTPVFANIRVQSYVEMQTLFDPAWPPGRIYYLKSGLIRVFSDALIEALIENATSMPTPLTAIAFQQLHGAAGRVSAVETAFPHRFDHHAFYIHPATDHRSEIDTIVRWGRECFAAVRPLTDHGVYVNAMEEAAGFDEQSARDAYGLNYERLAALKHRYDRTNFLTGNQNIAPG
jgi:hypothetical protein